MIAKKRSTMIHSLWINIRNQFWSTYNFGTLFSTFWIVKNNLWSTAPLSIDFSEFRIKDSPRKRPGNRVDQIWFSYKVLRPLTYRYPDSYHKRIRLSKLIFRSREKEELIRRLSRNQATADIFKNTKNIRKFSTNSIRGDYTTGTLVNMPNNDKSLSSVSSSHHSSKHTGTTASILTTGSLLTSSISLNPEQIQDPTKLRIAFYPSRVYQLNYIKNTETDPNWPISILIHFRKL